MYYTSMLYHYIGRSEKLNRTWVVRAHNVDDATQKVLTFCRDLLYAMDSASSEDIDIDLSFSKVDEDVTEL